MVRERFINTISKKTSEFKDFTGTWKRLKINEGESLEDVWYNIETGEFFIQGKILINFLSEFRNSGKYFLLMSSYHNTCIGFCIDSLSWTENRDPWFNIKEYRGSVFFSKDKDNGIQVMMKTVGVFKTGEYELIEITEEEYESGIWKNWKIVFGRRAEILTSEIA